VPLWKYRHRVYWILWYSLSILKVTFLKSNPFRFKETLISFNIKWKWHHKKGDAIRHCAMGNVDRSYFQPNKLLINLFSILWHKVWVLIYNMFIFEKVGHSKFVEMHGDTSDFFKLRSIYRTVADRLVSTLIPLQLENRLWTTVVLFHCCTLIWGLINNNYNLYLFQFMTVCVNIRSCYICIP
jgi:hypothetical protein